MKILFIFTDINSFHKLHIHFGIAYLARVLKNNGYDQIKVLSVVDASEYEHALREVKEFNPDIIGFTSVETQFGAVIELSRRIKEVSSCIVVCGGAFPTIYPECLRDAPHLDGIFRGECEEAFIKFVRAVEAGKDFKSIENFCFYDRASKTIIKNRLVPLSQDLDQIGAPYYDMFDFQKVIDSYGGIAPFLFNRGCPFNCAFCSNHALAAVYGKKNNITRRRSVDSCIAEISAAVKRYTFSAVHVWDDLFVSDRAWLYSFLDKYQSVIQRPFMCTARSNLVDDELFERLKKAGCYKIHMSLESGNEFIRNKIMRRNISQEMVVRSFILAKKWGLRINASTIIGLPFETEEMIHDTIALAGRLKIEDVGANIFYPYRGTHLRELCQEYGMITDPQRYDVCERRETILSLSHIKKERLYHLHDHFEELIRRHQGLSSYFFTKAKRAVRRVVPFWVKKAVRPLKQ